MVIEESVNLPVNQLMNPNIVSAEHDTTLKEVSKLMTKQKIGSVVVLDTGKPVGIVTGRDFATKAMTKDFLPDPRLNSNVFSINSCFINSICI